jgi:hypothetical protein
MPKQITQARGAQKKPAPAWLTETPLATYQLLSLCGDGFRKHPPQEIPLTVEEYEALKRQLATMRGYAVAEVAHA